MIHNALLPYRVPLFDALGKKHQMDVFVTENAYVDPTVASYNAHNLRKNARTSLGVLFRLVRILARGKYDVVITVAWDNLFELIQSCLLLMMARICGFRVILWTGSWNWDKRHISLERILANPLILQLARQADAIIVYGSKSHSLLLRLKANPEKLFIAFNHTELQLETNVGALTPITMDVLSYLDDPSRPGKYVVLYLSRIVAYKGLDVLLRAFKLIEGVRSDVALIVAGTGRYLPAMQRLSESLGLVNIRFIPMAIGSADKVALMRRCDVLVLTSKFHNGTCEAWGLVLNEAMTVGKAVVATDAVGSAYDLIEQGQNGFVVPQNDPASLSKAICSVLTSREHVDRMGKESKRIIESLCTLDHMSSVFDSAIDFALREGSEKPPRL